MHEVTSLILFQGLQLQVSVIPNDKTTTVTWHLGCQNFFTRNAVSTCRESYSDLTEHHESVPDPKALIEIVDDDDDPGTC